MRTLLSVVCLLIAGVAFADENVGVKRVEIKKPPVVVQKVKVQPKTGVALPVVRPFPGNYYWKHPHYGWGYWYYPAPTVAVPADFYLDQFGRVVPNGYVYDPDGNLVPLEVVSAPTPYYAYPYRYHYGRYYWYRR